VARLETTACQVIEPVYGPVGADAIIVYEAGQGQAKSVYRALHIDVDPVSRRRGFIRAYAKMHGWKVTFEIKDVGSEAKTKPKREELLKAGAAARLRS
jgi:hypothetical protein